MRGEGGGAEGESGASGKGREGEGKKKANLGSTFAAKQKQHYEATFWFCSFTRAFKKNSPAL